jgi:YteA family regulatory protein
VDTEHFRSLLLKEQQQYNDQINMIQETGLGNTSQGDQLQEDAHADNHPADLGTEMFEREKDLGLRSNAVRRLRDIDIALERMDSGLYGTCIECGGPIGEERLEVFPSATTCIRCQTLREAPADQFHRPIEEQVLNPPWGRSFRDGTGDPGAVLTVHLHLHAGGALVQQGQQTWNQRDVQHLVRHRETVHPRHLDVKEHGVRPEAANLLHRRQRIAKLRHDLRPAGQLTGQLRQASLFVIQQHDLQHR